MSLAVSNGLDNSSRTPRDAPPLVLGESSLITRSLKAVCRIAENTAVEIVVISFPRRCSPGHDVGAVYCLPALQTGVGVWVTRTRLFWGWPIGNFVFLGRDRPRGHVDPVRFWLFVSVKSGERVSTGRRKAIDNFRRGFVRARSPANPHRSCVLAFGLATSIEFEPLDVATIPQPVAVDVSAASTYGTVSLLFWYMAGARI